MIHAQDNGDLDQHDGRQVVTFWISKVQPTGFVEKTQLKEMSGTKCNTPNVVLTVAEDRYDFTFPFPGYPILTNTEILETSQPT